MAGFFDCGFARVAVKQSFKKQNGKSEMDKAKQLASYHAFFGGKNEDNFRVNQKVFNKRSPTLVNCFNEWLKNPVEKSNYIEHFSSKSWSKMSAVQRTNHSRSNCRACYLEHQSYQDTFPARANCLKKPSIVRTAVDELNQQVNLQPTGTVTAKVAVKYLYNMINEPFKENYNMNITKAMAKVPALNKKMRNSKTTAKQQRRERAREQKCIIEKHWEGMDVAALLGTRQSFSQSRKQRMALYFESKQEATIRSTKRKAQEEAGERIPKRHSPEPSSTNLDTVSLLEEVHNMKKGEKVINLTCQWVP